MTNEIQVQKMWGNVNPRIFERGAFPMLFKELELRSVAHSVAELATPNHGVINNLYLVGCATAKREIGVIKVANQSLAHKIYVETLFAADIAPQLLEVAARRIKHLHTFKVVGNYEVKDVSAEQINFKKGEGDSAALLGVYDMKALINDDQETNGEVLGLDEYSGPMRQVLGEQTQISPIIYKNGVFREGQTIVNYDSSDTNHNNAAVRQQLRRYHGSNPNICAMRVAIKHKSDINSPVFISTWFHLAVLQSIFKDLGLDPQINPLDCKKGVVLELHNRGFDRSYGANNIIFALNNVCGNLATGQILTDFINNVVIFCKN